MKPKIYFIIGSIITFLGLVFSVVVSIFFVGLVRFYFRASGPMANYRFNEMLVNFPWWTFVFAVVFLIVGIWIIHKYDFTAKVDFRIVIAGFIVAIIVGGLLVDFIGLNDSLVRKGYMRGPMKGYMHNINNR